MTQSASSVESTREHPVIQLIDAVINRFLDSDPLTYDEFTRLILIARRANQSWRLNQTVINLLYMFRPELVQKIESDPETRNAYNDDGVSNKVAKLLEREWNK